MELVQAKSEMEKCGLKPQEMKIDERTVMVFGDLSDFGKIGVTFSKESFGTIEIYWFKAYPDQKAPNDSPENTTIFLGNGFAVHLNKGVDITITEWIENIFKWISGEALTVQGQESP